MARQNLIGRNRPDRKAAREAYYAALYAKAQHPQAVAAVEWDRLRVETRQLPPRDAEKLWSEVSSTLARFRKRATGEDHPA